jgi:hypothetical protein
MLGDRCDCRRGLTRVDLLVVGLVLLTAIGILLALIPRARESSDRVQCAFNLKQIGDGVRRYHDRTNTLPPARIADPYATWAVLLAADLKEKQPNPLQGWDLQKSYYAQPAAARETQIAVYYCPARRQPPQISTSGDVPGGNPGGQLYAGALGDYACAAGDDSKDHHWAGPGANGPIILGEVLRQEGDRVLEWRSRTSLADLVNRESYTILIGDKHVPRGQFGAVSAGDGSLYNGEFPGSFSRVGGPGFGLARTPTDPYNRNFGSYHIDAVQFLMADGAAKAFTPDLDEAVLGRLTTRNLPPEKKR